MNILSIETSCDETALAVLECSGNLSAPRFTLRAETVASQIEIHKPFGGVFPMLAKREHARNLVPLFMELLQKAGMRESASPAAALHSGILENIRMVLEREPDLFTHFKEHILTIKKPPVDAIAVTQGPGLEPTLWVGINFARALGLLWNIPILPTNHMEGHIMSVLLDKTDKIKSQKSKIKIEFPAVALLVSGGHTQLVLVRDWLQYELLGETRDDAVGEAFDKVARILGLPYPGGPEISRLADEARAKKYPEVMKLPRPMLNSGNYDFSFSGLKTAVLYGVKKLGTLSDEQRGAIACEFEDAAIEVLLEKTKRALQEHSAKTLVIGGGVVANRYLRGKFTELMREFPNTTLLLPEHKLSTDNAVMIAMAAYVRNLASPTDTPTSGVVDIVAQGTMKL